MEGACSSCRHARSRPPSVTGAPCGPYRGGEGYCAQFGLTFIPHKVPDLSAPLGNCWEAPIVPPALASLADRLAALRGA